MLLWFHASHSRAATSLVELRDWLKAVDWDRRAGNAKVLEPARNAILQQELVRLREKGTRKTDFSRRNSDRRAFRELRRALAIVAGLATKKKRRKLARKIVSKKLLLELVRDIDRRNAGGFWNMPDSRIWDGTETVWLSGLVEQGLQLEKLQREFDDRLLQEKLASLRQLAYGASHEINNPLANIAMRAQSLQRHEQSESRLKSLRTIYDQAMRAHHMITDLMLFAKPPAVHRQPTDVVKLVSEIIGETAARYPDRKFRMALVRPVRNLHSTVDPEQIAELVAALIQNSIDAFVNPGEISLAVDWNSQNDLVIRVGDNGPGIDGETARHMFDPFFSGREAGRGLGFGLSKAWTIAQQHGGELRCVSTEPGNTLFEATIPAAGPGEKGSTIDRKSRQAGQSAA